MCSARQACSLSKAERLKHTLGIYGVQEAVIALARSGALPLQTGFSTVLKKKSSRVHFPALFCLTSSEEGRTYWKRRAARAARSTI